jgi:membrane protein DedA with SNARE-associated domain
MTQLFSAVAAMPAWVTYLIVAVLATGESAAFVGLFLPGETALLLGGVLAGTGQLSLLPLVAIAALAAVIGDSLGYELGRHFGPRLQQSRAGRLVGDRRWRQAEEFMARRGGWAVFTGRWVGIMRALTPALAGAIRMPYRRFLAFNAAGGVLWATTVVAGGYLAGASWQRVQGYLGQVSVYLLIGSAAVVAGAVLVRLLRRRNTQGEDGPEDVTEERVPVSAGV